MKKKKIYFIGIKGVGMCAYAHICKAFGYAVSGSDTHEKFFTDEVLKRQHIVFFEGFKKSHITKDIDLIVVSQAYFRRDRGFVAENPEVKEALQKNIPLLLYPEAVAKLFNKCTGIAVCGSHGKTSTTSMLGEILKKSGMNTIALIGSEVLNWKSNALVSIQPDLKKSIHDPIFSDAQLEKVFFAIEADEYREAFLQYFPKITVLLNIDYDPPDYYKTKESYTRAFEKFIAQLQQPQLLITTQRIKISPQIKIIQPTPYAQPLSIPGDHYQNNAAHAAAAADAIGIPKEIIISALKAWRGVKRRFEIYGTYKGITLVDDYAHHPTEVASVANSLRSRGVDTQKTWIVFQSHTYTRTLELFDDFAKALSLFNHVVILKTYSSAREQTFLKNVLKSEKKKKQADGSGLAEVLTNAARKACSEKTAVFVSTHAQAESYLKKHIQKGNWVLTVGAGDGWKILEKLKNFKIAKLKN